MWGRCWACHCTELMADGCLPAYAAAEQASLCWAVLHMTEPELRCNSWHLLS